MYVLTKPDHSLVSDWIRPSRNCLVLGFDKNILPKNPVNTCFVISPFFLFARRDYFKLGDFLKRQSSANFVIPLYICSRNVCKVHIYVHGVYILDRCMTLIFDLNMSGGSILIEFYSQFSSCLF